LRRRRSAALNFLGFGFAFDPGRAPPAPAATAPERTGARRRASRQMKYEIPASSTTAPSAIATAAPPDKPPPADGLVFVFVMTWDGGAVVVVCPVELPGSPGANGLLEVPPP
jgi:hypothetical protein